MAEGASVLRQAQDGAGGPGKAYLQPSGELVDPRQREAHDEGLLPLLRRLCRRRLRTMSELRMQRGDGRGSGCHAVVMGRLYGRGLWRAGSAQRHAERADGHVGHGRRDACALPLRLPLRAAVPRRGAGRDGPADTPSQYRDDSLDAGGRHHADRSHGAAAGRDAAALLRRHDRLHQDRARAGRPIRPDLSGRPHLARAGSCHPDRDRGRSHRVLAARQLRGDVLLQGGPARSRARVRCSPSPPSAIAAASVRWRRQASWWPRPRRWCWGSSSRWSC